MRKTPVANPIWVRYEAKSNLVQLMAVSPEAEVAHRRLADSVWSTGRWPVTSSQSTRDLARANPETWPAILRELRGIGWHTHGARLVNHDVGQVLNEAKAYRASKSSSGQCGAKARWHRSQSQPPFEQLFPGLPLEVRQPTNHGTGNGKRIHVAHDTRIGTAIAKKCPVQNSNSTVPIAVSNADRLTRSVLPRKGSASLEKQFIEELKETMQGFSAKFAGAELENWGGWWRNRFREKPDKARRVLAEIKSMVKEHRILTDPGKAATDLWGRLP